MDKVGISIYQTYLDQEVSESDKFFVAYINYDDTKKTDCQNAILEY